MRWVGYIGGIAEIRNSYKTLVGKPEGKTPLGKPRRRCGNNNKMDLKGIECEGVN
jgi:hypothetical protein